MGNTIPSTKYDQVMNPAERRHTPAANSILFKADMQIRGLFSLRAAAEALTERSVRTSPTSMSNVPNMIIGYRGVWAERPISAAT